MRTKLLLALTASSLLVFAAATPALAIHNGWDTTTDSNQGNSNTDCNTSNGCTTITTEQPKGQVDKKDTPSPKEDTCTSTAPGQCK